MIPFYESCVDKQWHKCNKATLEVYRKLETLFRSLDTPKFKVKDEPNVAAFGVIFPNPVGEQKITGMSIVVPYCLKNEESSEPVVIETYLITENSWIEESLKVFIGEESAYEYDNISKLVIYINDCNLGNIDFSNFD